MENTLWEKARLLDAFRACQPTLLALGDETRLHLLSVMIGGECRGSRVLDLARQTNLSRPAVSHHIRILRGAGIVRARREGTCIYYYLEPDREETARLVALFRMIGEMTRRAPDRSDGE